MNPIIDPSVFYWIGVVDSAVVFLGLSGAMLTAMVCVVAMTRSIDEEDVVVLPWMKAVLAYVFFAFVSMVFIPSSDTLIKMKVAEKLTPNVIAEIKSEGKGLVEFLTGEIKEIIKESKEKED